MVKVLHTWGQNLMTHPHLHCIVPAGGWNDNQGKWNPSSKKFFIPVKVMSRMFKGKFMALLRKEYTGGNLKFTGELSRLANGSGFKLLVSGLYDKDWVVCCKKTIGFARYKSRFNGLNWMQMLVVLTGKNFSVCPVCHKGKMVFDGELAPFRAPP